MTAQLFIVLLLLTVLLVYIVVATRTWVHVRGSRVVTCPETQKPVAVKVAASSDGVFGFLNLPGPGVLGVVVVEDDAAK